MEWQGNVATYCKSLQAAGSGGSRVSILTLMHDFANEQDRATLAAASVPCRDSREDTFDVRRAAERCWQVHRQWSDVMFMRWQKSIHSGGGEISTQKQSFPSVQLTCLGTQRATTSTAHLTIRIALLVACHACTRCLVAARAVLESTDILYCHFTESVHLESCYLVLES